MQRSAPEPLVCRRWLRAGRRVRSVAERRRIRCPASSSVAIPGGGNNVVLALLLMVKILSKVWVLPSRVLFRACRPVSRAKRSAMIKLLVLSRFTNAGQPQEGVSPALLRMSGHRLRSVRSSPICGEVRVYAELVLYNNARPRHDGARNGVERAERHEAGLAECAESSGAKWRSRGDGAEPPRAKRCALRGAVRAVRV